jgi:hypothetical protein
MRCHLFTLLALAGVAAAQPSSDRVVTVAAGAQADVLVSISSASAGDLIDVLSSVSDDSVVLHFFLPDGRELTEDDMEESGFALSAFRSSDIGRLQPRFRKAVLAGTGDQFFLMFLGRPPEGNYRIQVDARAAKAPVSVTARFIRTADIPVDQGRSKPAIMMAVNRLASR